MRTILSLFFCLTMLMVAAQQKKETTYTAEYKIIDSLILKERLTKTAIDKINQLYKKAVAEKQEAEQIKALVYKADLENEITEEGFINTIQIFKTALKKTNSKVMEAVIHTIIAKKYNDYYNNQRWTLLSKKNWNSQSFKDSIEMHFNAAIKYSKEIQSVYIDDYSAVILGGSAPLKNYSLYHLLIAEQIQYYSNELGNDGTKENNEKILKLYESIFQIHPIEPKNNIVARFKLDLLVWKKQNELIKEDAYLLELKNYTHSEYTSSIKASAWFLIANTVAEKGKNYHALNDTANQFELVKALEIIEEAATKVDTIDFKYSGLLDLKNEIKNKQIWVEVEKINEPLKPFRAYLSYKNTVTLYLKIYKVPFNFQLKFNTTTNQLKELTIQKKVQEQAIPLIQTNDYQTHFTEIKIDPIQQGNYIILTSTGKDFNLSADKIGYIHFAVSDWIYYKDNNYYFIRDYSTGKPINQAEVKIFETKYDYKTSITSTQLIQQTQTNENGQFSIPQKLNGNTQIEINKKKSQLIFSEYEYRYQEYNNEQNEKNNYEQNNRRIYFFTDRSIYRPGQLVQFKGIALTRDYDTKHSKVIADKKPVKIYLLNTNRQIIDSLLLPINDYGSLVGSFALPKNELTGNFSIEAQAFNYSSKFIKVEEYKRPTIKLIFDQPTIGYRLNDSIRYTIKAQAYAGNIVNGAKVKYTVKQYAVYPYPISRNIDPIYQTGKEVTNGIGITNEKGEFTISFKAIYDSTKQLGNDFSVNYIIHADITDLNGETQSGNVNITATKTAWQLVINHPIAVDKQSFQKINAIAIDKLGNEKNTSIQTALFKVLQPNIVVRKKYWGRSDKMLFDETSYRKYFPYDEYQNESNQDNWAIEETATPINKVETGMYKIKATAIDSFGLTITTEKIITIYDVNEGTNSKQTFHYYSNNYTKPGDSILSVINYPLENTYVTKKIKTAQQKEAYQFLQLSKLTQQQIIISAEDRGGIVINEAYIWKGRLFTHQQAIAVQFNNKDLKIRTGTYRNINEPGSKETWTIEIDGLNGKEKAAELLTSMYDASLDAIYPNRWDPLKLSSSNTSSTSFSSNIFRTETLRQFDNYECFCEAKPYIRPSILASINLPWRIREQRLYETMASESKKSMTASPAPGNIAIRGVNTFKEESYDKVYTT
ncbi:MAG: MG2 domain-containing protein, partial [Sediminibacterium sp.]